MTKRIAFVLFLLLAVSGAAFADEASAAAASPAGDAAKSLTVKTFQFKHKDADKAAAVVKPLMSADGSISIQPSSNSVVITDRPENLKAISAALEKFDAPAQAFKVSVRLVGASRVEAAAARTAEGLKDVAPKFSVLPFNNFELLGSVNLEGREGEPGMFDVESGYRADFKFGDYDQASDSIRINDFKLSKLQGDQLNQLLKTSINLKIGQTVVLGAGRPQGQRALMIIIAAKR